MPASWRQYHRLAGSREPSGVTRTAEGIAADPLNVALVGTRDEVVEALRAAGWCPADRITIRSGLRDATSVLFHRPYASAPVSTHVLWGRPQDLAFEQIVGGSPRRRHHVRLWQANQPLDPREHDMAGGRDLRPARRVSRATRARSSTTSSRGSTPSATGSSQDLGGAGRLARMDCVAGLRARRAGPQRLGRRLRDRRAAVRRRASRTRIRPPADPSARGGPSGAQGRGLRSWTRERAS